MNDPPNRYDWQVSAELAGRFFRWERLVGGSSAGAEPGVAVSSWPSLIEVGGFDGQRLLGFDCKVFGFVAVA